MKKFTVKSGLVMPLDRANVDTDFIIPKQFLKSIKRSGFGVNLFDEHRYLDKGEPDMDNSSRPLNPDFVLNQARYQGASILLARDNFGCGSSREHAPWALDDYGFRVILAPSFADIFFNNCFKNGILPIVLPRQTIDELFMAVLANEGYSLEVDLEKQELRRPDAPDIQFEVDAFRNDIGITLEDAELISAFELRWREQAPWYFAQSDDGVTESSETASEQQS
jgi:3-isopropylmalate/(R)-2-methylmalate dehydratase small subunit